MTRASFRTSATFLGPRDRLGQFCPEGHPLVIQSNVTHLFPVQAQVQSDLNLLGSSSWDHLPSSRSFAPSLTCQMFTSYPMLWH